MSEGRARDASHYVPTYLVPGPWYLGRTHRDLYG
jgi:hypothetical protein